MRLDDPAKYQSIVDAGEGPPAQPGWAGRPCISQGCRSAPGRTRACGAARRRGLKRRRSELMQEVLEPECSGRAAGSACGG